MKQRKKGNEAIRSVEGYAACTCLFALCSTCTCASCVCNCNSNNPSYSTHSRAQADVRSQNSIDTKQNQQSSAVESAAMPSGNSAQYTI